MCSLLIATITVSFVLQIHVFFRPFALGLKIAQLHLCDGSKKKEKGSTYTQHTHKKYNPFSTVITHTRQSFLISHMRWCVNRHFTRCITFCGLYILKFFVVSLFHQSLILPIFSCCFSLHSLSLFLSFSFSFSHSQRVCILFVYSLRCILYGHRIMAV